jgi:hypothetical protein
MRHVRLVTLVVALAGGLACAEGSGTPDTTPYDVPDVPDTDGIGP